MVVLRSHIDMLPNELSDILFVHEIIVILLPIESGLVKELISHASIAYILLNLHVVVGQAGNSASLPGEHASIPSIIDRNEEEQSVQND